MNPFPSLVTPSIYLQSVPYGDEINSPLYPSSKRYIDMYIQPESDELMKALSQQGVVKMVSSKTHLAILSGN